MDCSSNKTLMICTCEGDQDSIYKIYNTDTKTYHCCTKDLDFVILDQSYSDVKSYLTALNTSLSSRNLPCKDFYESVAELTDDQIKSTYSFFYNFLEQRMYANNLLYEGGEPDLVQPAENEQYATITCSSSDYIPVFVTFQDGFFNKLDVFGCMTPDQTSTVFSKDMEFKAYYLNDKDGKPCKTSECTLKGDFTYTPIIGSLFVDNSKKYSHISHISVIVLISVIALIIVGLIIYFIYRKYNAGKNMRYFSSYRNTSNMRKMRKM